MRIVPSPSLLLYHILSLVAKSTLTARRKSALLLLYFLSLVCIKYSLTDHDVLFFFVFDTFKNDAMKPTGKKKLIVYF
jgi:hypothetical protein